MKKDFRLLVLGDIYNPHIIRFVKHLKGVNKECHIDIICNYKGGGSLDKEYLSCFDDYALLSIEHHFKKIPLINKLETLFNWRTKLRSFTRGKHYDIVNIHYPNPFYSYLIKDLKSVSSNIVVSPWGSDVYRVSGNQKEKVKKLFDSSDYVTGSGDRFTEDFMRIFDVPKDKFARADLGSEMIDYILENVGKLDTEKAKRHFNLQDYYVITCAYNAAPEQRHLQIVDAIKDIRKELPNNLCLLFPMAYPSNPGYIKEIKNRVTEYGLNSLFIEDFFDLPNLFLLRQATDMFIHVQTTDANCTSLREYLLCQKKVINGAWLKYDELEQDGTVPYFVVDSLSSLGQVIVNAYNSDKLNLSSKAYEVIVNMGCKRSAICWNNLFTTIS